MLRRTMLLASAAIAVQPIGAVADPLGDGSFAQSIARLLASAHPKWVVNTGDDPLLVRIGSTAVYLRNIYLHVQELPLEERDAATVALIERGLAKNLDTTASLDTLRTSLRLQIAPREYRRAMPLIVSRDFMADLMMVYAIDQNERYALPLQPQFEGWHVSQETVDEIAVANLETASDQIEIQPPKHKGTGGYFTLQTYDGFDAARLLLPRFMARVRQALRSPIVFAGIPNRDFLVVWTPDFSRRSAFATLIDRDITLQPQPLTRAIFVVSGMGTRLANSDELAGHGRR